MLNLKCLKCNRVKKAAPYIAIILFATTLIILALSCIFSHKEIGLLQIKLNKGSAFYDVKGSSTIPLKWDNKDLPLTYCLWGFEPDELKHFGSAVDAAVNMWNRELSCTIFIKGKDDKCNVKISYATSLPNKFIGATTTHYGGSTYASSASVIFNNYYDSQTLYLVAAHEFGHVLGLAHDDFESSIMFPLITSPNWQKPTFLPLPTKHDIKLLQYLCEYLEK